MCSKVAGIGADPGDVHAALVGERVAPHVGRVGIGREVEQLGDVVGRRRERRQLGVGEALVAELELEVGDDRDEVGVAAPLAVAVHRPLDVGGPGLTAASALATPQPASSWVWMPTRTVGAERRHDLGHGRRRPRWGRVPPLVSQQTTVSAPASAAARRQPQRVVAVVGVAVEEVLGVIDHPLALRDQEGHRLGDHPQVLVAVDLDDLLQVKRPGLAHERAHRREALGDDAQGRIGVGRHPAPAGHAEGGRSGRARTTRRPAAEQLELLGVGAGEAGLDQVEPELVEPVGDAQLLARRQRHALALHPVAQGGVIELDPRAHGAALRGGDLDDVQPLRGSARRGRAGRRRTRAGPPA